MRLIIALKIVDRGVIPLTMKLLLSPSDEVVEQALWTLGNIIGESVAYRDITINLDIIPRMLAMNLIRKSVQFRRTFIWVIVNLLRIKDPQISLANAQSMIPTINGLVMNVDSTAKVDALWALTYIADGNEEYIQLVIDSGIISAVVPLLSNHRIKVQLAAMRLLGNIATGTDEQTNVLLNNDILIHIRFPLMHPKDNLRRMALWCMSNITVGSQEQVQAVFHSGLLGRIVESLSREDMKTSREALFTVNNMISLATKEQVLDVINVGAINPLFQLLLSIDEQMARLAQNALKTLFQKADQLVEKYSEIYARLLRSP